MASSNELTRVPLHWLDGGADEPSLRYPVAKIAAFAAVRDNDPALAARAWELLLAGDVEVTWDQINWFGTGPDVVRGGTVHETGLALIDCSQWGLNVMFLLGLAPAALEAAARQTGWKPGKMRSLEKAP